jgi:hypothetical protein
MISAHLKHTKCGLLKSEDRGVGMKKSGEIQKHTKGLTSAKYDSRSAEFKQEQKKAKKASENEN